MKKGFIFLSFFATFLFLFISSSLAINVNITPNPETVNATTYNQLINFTLANIGGTSINYVEINLPSDFYLNNTSGSSLGGSTIGNPTEQDQNTGRLVWDNINITNDTTEYFWVYADIPSRIGKGVFNFTTKDSNSILIKNVSVNIIDTTPPNISEVTFLPTNNSKYLPDKTYNFLAKVSDNINVDKVIFEFNGTNRTASQEGSSYVASVKDLPVGCYPFRWYSNDTSNNWVSTEEKTYCVIKGNNPITIYFNGAENSDYKIEINETLNITVTAKGKINVTQNGTFLGPINSQDEYEYETNFKKIGVYEYKAVVSGNENYTSNTSKSYYVTVIYHKPRYKSLSYPSKEYYAPGKSYKFKAIWYSLDYPENNLTSIYFTINGKRHDLTVEKNQTESSYTVTDLSAGVYPWMWCAEDSQGEKTCISETLVVEKATPNIKLHGLGEFAVPANISVVGYGCPEQLACYLYMNGTKLSKIYYENQVTSPTVYYFVFNTSGNSNYTSKKVDGYVYVLMAPTSNQTSSSNQSEQSSQSSQQSSSGSQSTGSSSVEIELTESKFFERISKDTPVSFKPENPNIFRIDEILVEPEKDLSNVTITVSLEGISNVKPPEKSKVYSYIKIDTNINESDIKNVKIKFRVKKIWLKSNNIKESDVYLYRMENGWTKLDTKVIDSDESYVYYQSESPGLSIYAIGAETTEQKTLTWVIVIIAFIIVGFLVYLFWPTPSPSYRPYS